MLAAAGLDVVVLEAGGYYDDADFDGGELDGLGRMYMYGGGRRHARPERRPARRRCLGGGTVVNYSTSFRTPDDVRDEWAATACPRSRRDEYARQPRRRLRAAGRQPGAQRARRRATRCCARACIELGWHVDAMPRNVRGCDQGESCGYCGFGCRLRREAVDA